MLYLQQEQVIKNVFLDSLDSFKKTRQSRLDLKGEGHEVKIFFHRPIKLNSFCTGENGFKFFGCLIKEKNKYIKFLLVSFKTLANYRHCFESRIRDQFSKSIFFRVPENPFSAIFNRVF